MENLYFWFTLITYIILIVLSVNKIVINRQKKQLALPIVVILISVTGSFFLFGINSKQPDFQVNKRVKQKMIELNLLKDDLIGRKQKVISEIDKLSEENYKHVEEINILKEKHNIRFYKEAILYSEILNNLKLYQHGRAYIDRLKKVNNELDIKIGEIKITQIKAQSDLLEWETMGGMNGDLDSYILEEKLELMINQYNRKISITDTTSFNIMPLGVIWTKLPNETR